jgi:hypothetical protein
MVQLIADDASLLKDLRHFLEPVEVVDASGKLLGVFVPANLERAREIQAKLGAKIDWAEVERRAQSKEPGLSLKEVFQQLQSLTPDEKMRAYLQAKIDRLEGREGCATP